MGKLIGDADQICGYGFSSTYLGNKATSPVVDTVCEILPYIDLAIWVCDFIDNLAITVHIDLQRNWLHMSF